MKKSLPLIGLAMFAGLAASAQAATAVHRLHAQDAGAGVFAAALGYDNGLLSALGNLISGNPQATADAVPTSCDCRQDTQAVDRQPTPPLPPGPATAAPMAGSASMPADASGAAPAEPQPPVVPANGGGQVPVDTRSDLGWQSLLPGSIQ